MAKLVGARVYDASNQAIDNDSTTVVAFDSERYDTDTIHDTSTNNSMLTCKTAGVYSISGHIQFEANATGLRLVGILLDGATTIAYMGWSDVGASAIYLPLETKYTLAVNQYVELVVYQNSGGALNIVKSGSNFTNEFMMSRIG